MNFTTACLARKNSKSRNNKFSQPARKSFLAGCLIILCLASCNKPADSYLQTNSGKGLLNLLQTDTFTINMVSEFWPRLAQTSNLTADELGDFNDPIFGRTTAAVYAQVRIGSVTAPTWNSSSTMDSIVLTLKMSDITTQLVTNMSMGNNNFAGQTWHLFKVANTINTGLVYPSDTSLATSMEIGNGVVRFNGSDSILTLSIKGSKINKIFKDSMFDSTGNASLFTDPTYFDQLMHGIYILPDSVLTGAGNTGEIAPFNLSDSTSKLSIFYNGNLSPWFMVMNSPAERINVYTHNFTNTIAWKNASNPPKNNDRVYLQSLGGMRCIVTIPNLANLVKNNMIAVNQAEFIFPKVDSSADPYNADYPPKILFRPRTYNGNDSLYNFTDETIDYYQQNYQTASKSYKYIMTRYIQRLLYVYRNNTNVLNYGINLKIPPDNPNAPFRTLLYTQHAGNKQNRPKLVLTYTKIVDRK